jgi:hypothetical protein
MIIVGKVTVRAKQEIFYAVTDVTVTVSTGELLHCTELRMTSDGASR